MGNSYIVYLLKIYIIEFIWAHLIALLLVITIYSRVYPFSNNLEKLKSIK